MQIYCPNPTDKRIFYSDKIVPQDFNEYPNQLFFYKPLNQRDDPNNSTMHFDVLLPDTFYMNMDLEENYELEKGNQKDSGDDGDEKDTKKSVQKKPSSSKKKEVKRKLMRKKEGCSAKRCKK